MCQLFKKFSKYPCSWDCRKKRVYEKKKPCEVCKIIPYTFTIKVSGHVNTLPEYQVLALIWAQPLCPWPPSNHRTDDQMNKETWKFKLVHCKCFDCKIRRCLYEKKNPKITIGYVFLNSFVCDWLQIFACCFHVIRLTEITKK